MSKRGSFFEGFIFGALIGLVGGIIFAPTSGEETRRKLTKLRDEQDDIIRETKDKTEALVAKTMDAIDKGLNKLGRMAEASREDVVENNSKG